MLQRKLLVLLGSVVVLLLGVGVATVLVLHGALEELNASTARAFRQSAAVMNIGRTLTSVEAALELRAAGGPVPVEPLGQDLETLERLAEDLHDGAEAPDDAAQRLDESLAALRGHVANITATVARADTRPALATCAALRASVDALGKTALEDSEAVQARIAARLRWTIFGLGIAFVAMLNVSILLLMRAGAMVIRPVDQLVEASRRLAREEFEYRIDLDRRGDEFGELARATNALAEQLQFNEERKIETLGQVARTLNHELNNALSIIQLQLDLVARSTRDDSELAERMRQIHDALERMRGTVAALTRIRRIVLTKYTEGVQMLDIERSISAPASAAALAAKPDSP